MASGMPDTIIIHYTAGPSAKSAIRTFKDDDANVSAHIVMDFDGSITQMVDFNVVAWHAGKSKLGSRSGFNKYSIGIEIVNAGLLEKDDEEGGYEAWWGKNYKESEVVKAIHRNGGGARYWHKFTDEQIAATKELCRVLKDTYNITAIHGHEEVSPGRKVDPGPAFPLDELRQEVFGLKTKEEESDSPVGKEGKVSASSLNIRSAPSTSGEKLADPLPNGTNVEVLEEGDGWYKVKTTVEIEGWVSAKYIKMD